MRVAAGSPKSTQPQCAPGSFTLNEKPRLVWAGLGCQPRTTGTAFWGEVRWVTASTWDRLGLSLL